eukprot:TRINITY_DN10296_c0_g1_i1.p1 TRINITY_DN10296_c0_g1~~TRINITY_DN10296_c0_g1_i1.p1  ORF type:complete len:141 (-),score=30.87 TRINITY_DN10296_c0_g1_i1:27-449(-)
MADSDRIGVTADIKLDYLVEKRKSGRTSKQVVLTLSRDEWGNIVLILNRSKKVSYKLEDNITRLYTENLVQGKITIELTHPQMMIFISNAEKFSLIEFTKILKQIHEHPEECDGIELYKGEAQDEEEERQELAAVFGDEE